MSEIQKRVLLYKHKVDQIRNEIAKVIVGQREVVDSFLLGLITRGHVLVEGVPGVAKTALVTTMSHILDCDSKRIQFTPDIIPTDITGISVYTGSISAGHTEKAFSVVKGPVFSNIILADEINRASPKVQSALLEAMQEHQVTIAKKTYPLPEPFFVFATQNPIEQTGVYNLPAAQVDRFIFKIFMGYPNFDEEQEVLYKNLNLKGIGEFKLKKIATRSDIINMQAIAKQIYMKPEVEKYIIKLIDATRTPKKYGLEMGKYIEHGSSPRGSINLFIASKAHAMIHGRTYVIPEDVKKMAPNVLRHRILLTYEAQAEAIKSDQILDEMLKKIPVP